MTLDPKPLATGFDPAGLIKSHQSGVWRYLRSLGCDPSLADDLTQETFLAVLQKPFEQYNPQATAGYLRKVAYSLFISHYRRLGKQLPLGEIELAAATWDRWAADDDGQALLDILRECLGQLTERARRSLEMRFREAASRADIAAALEITEHGAKNLMQRAKQQLRDCIERKQS